MPSSRAPLASRSKRLTGEIHILRQVGGSPLLGENEEVFLRLVAIFTVQKAGPYGQLNCPIRKRLAEHLRFV